MQRGRAPTERPSPTDAQRLPAAAAGFESRADFCGFQAEAASRTSRRTQPLSAETPAGRKGAAPPRHHHIHAHTRVAGPAWTLTG